MYTQCPACLTVYRLEADLLVPAAGHVRCEHCGTVFQALTTLTAQLPPEPFSRLVEHAPDGIPPAAGVAVFRPREPSPSAHDLVADAPPDPRIDDFSQLVFTPPFASRPRRSWRTPAWIAVCVVLLLGLAAQLAWAKRDALVTDDTIGPMLVAGCKAMGCHLPLVARPARLRLMARDVERHPTAHDGLLITASVRNDAPFDQPYPVVVIVLSDANGRRLAMRRFRPDDYVGDAAVRAHGLPGGATTAMVFEVQDPGQQAVAFAFSFE